MKVTIKIAMIYTVVSSCTILGNVSAIQQQRTVQILYQPTEFSKKFVMQVPENYIFFYLTGEEEVGYCYIYANAKSGGKTSDDSKQKYSLYLQHQSPMITIEERVIIKPYREYIKSLNLDTTIVFTRDSIEKYILIANAMTVADSVKIEKGCKRNLFWQSRYIFYNTPLVIKCIIISYYHVSKRDKVFFEECLLSAHPMK
jgi:hypothetical protein